MNIYVKMQECRVKLQAMNLKKSGENKFAGFKYYELGDFLPEINKLMQEAKLFSFINFSNEAATLTIINAEKPEETVTFTAPTGELNLKGCNEIQNLGGVQTYMRRYLYMNAFEIVENDQFDAVTGKGQTISDAQVKRLYAIARSKGVTGEELAKALKGYGITEAKELNKANYDNLIERIEKK